ncbi:MAG: hypothetical protein IJV16_07270 [Lachnospiraceae bacterium]|nr:hypothetical protein [Lachnospiraceae bacterium]
MKYKYTCEICGKTAVMTPEEAHKTGWDYPPYIGDYGVVGSRTCPDCPMMKTAWAALTMENKSLSELTDKQKETVKRIQGEPENMILKE